MQEKIDKYVEECCKYCTSKKCEKGIVVSKYRTMLDGQITDIYITKCVDYTSDREIKRRPKSWQVW